MNPEVAKAMDDTSQKEDVSEPKGGFHQDEPSVENLEHAAIPHLHAKTYLIVAVRHEPRPQLVILMLKPIPGCQFPFICATDPVGCVWSGKSDALSVRKEDVAHVWPII